MIPTNPARSGDPHKDLETAQKAIAEATSRGRTALEKAYGIEFSNSLDMLGAANVIVKLKAERDQARREVATEVNSARTFSSQIASDISMIVGINGSGTLADNSALRPVSQVLTRLRDELLSAKSELESFKANMRHTMTDRGMAELPGLQGYFSGATPLLSAAEAAAVLTHHKTDNQAKQGYLRKRGWILRSEGWHSPSIGQTRPLEFAVQMQVQADTAPFKILAAPMRNVPRNEASKVSSGEITHTPTMMPEEVEV